VVELANQPLTIIGVAPCHFVAGWADCVSMCGAHHHDHEFKDTGEAMRRRDWRFFTLMAAPAWGEPESSSGAASTVMQRLAREQADTNRDLDMAVLRFGKRRGRSSAFLPLLRSLAAAAVCC